MIKATIHLKQVENSNLETPIFLIYQVGIFNLVFGNVSKYMVYDG
jgi:hypothetical protein